MSRPSPTGALTLRAVFTIPDVARADDYVLRLSNSVQSDHVAQTLASYVVTDELAEAFDLALGVVEDALRSGKNRAAFIEGSFGSGKSHFMAVLHAILGHHPQARSIARLQPILDRHRPLESATLLRLTFHFLDSDSVESTLFRQYLEQISVRHPARRPPDLHSAQGRCADAAARRRTIGDDAFRAGLTATAPAAGSLWGRLGVGAAAWTAQRYDECTAPTASLEDRRQAQQALVNARVALVTAQHDRVVASYAVLNAVGRLSPVVLKLPTTVYDPSVHYHQVRDSWFGVRTPDGR